MENEVCLLKMVDYDSSFRTEDGTLLVKCLFVNDNTWYERYMKEADISIGSDYNLVYKPTKKGLYKISFKRKED